MTGHTASSLPVVPSWATRQLIHVDLETSPVPVVVTLTEYPDDHSVPLHRHNRGQLLHAVCGVVMVSTPAGRWMVPPGHAMWLPAETRHQVDMLGPVAMLSAYVRPDAADDLPRDLRVVAPTPLTRALMTEAVGFDLGAPSRRAELVRALLIEEIPRLPERPLALPLPAERRLAALCRRHLEDPAAPIGIEAWAREAGMSRRSFTRAFRRETGLSLSAWRQQACLLAALPRLADGEPVTRVALDLGYESVPAFTTMFRRMLGAAPKAWLKG